MEVQGQFDLVDQCQVFELVQDLYAINTWFKFEDKFKTSQKLSSSQGITQNEYVGNNGKEPVKVQVRWKPFNVQEVFQFKSKVFVGLIITLGLECHTLIIQGLSCFWHSLFEVVIPSFSWSTIKPFHVGTWVCFGYLEQGLFVCNI